MPTSPPFCRGRAISPDRIAADTGTIFVKTIGEQAMAANVDLCFLVTSMNEDYSVNRIARYAAAVFRGKNVCLRHMCAFDYVFYP